MKNKSSTACTLLASLMCLVITLFSHPATANGYIGVDGTSISINSAGGGDINPIGVRLRLGTRVSRVFDIEAQFGGGSDDETTSTFDELGASYMGCYLKGYLPLGRYSAVYALAGGAALELTQTIGEGKFSDERTGFSYGFGLETQLSRHMDLSADFMRYTIDDNEFTAVSAINLGIKWYF